MPSWWPSPSPWSCPGQRPRYSIDLDLYSREGGALLSGPTGSLAWAISSVNRWGAACVTFMYAAVGAGAGKVLEDPIVQQLHAHRDQRRGMDREREVLERVRTDVAHAIAATACSPGTGGPAWCLSRRVPPPRGGGGRSGSAGRRHLRRRGRPRPQPASWSFGRTTPF